MVSLWNRLKKMVKERILVTVSHAVETLQNFSLHLVFHMRYIYIRLEFQALLEENLSEISTMLLLQTSFKSKSRDFVRSES